MKTILANIILSIFIFGIMTNQAIALVDSDNKPKKRKVNSTHIKIDKINDVSSLNNTVEFLSWYYIEFEIELPVTDLNKINITERVVWMFPEKEPELEVEDFTPTEKLVSYWMIVDKESELDVKDLAQE